MSQAFIRERDEQWLHEVSPTMQALIVYLTRENNGIRIHEVKNYYSEKHQREVHEMSDGLTYSKSDEGKWQVLLDL